MLFACFVRPSEGGVYNGDEGDGGVVWGVTTSGCGEANYNRDFSALLSQGKHGASSSSCSSGTSQSDTQTGRALRGYSKLCAKANMMAPSKRLFHEYALWNKLGEYRRLCRHGSSRWSEQVRNCESVGRRSKSVGLRHRSSVR